MKKFSPPSQPHSLLERLIARKNLTGWLPIAIVWWLLNPATVLGSPAPARWTGLADTLFTHHTDPEVASGTAIAQDGTGFIWLATQSGLTRWDGYHFRHYSAEPQTPGSLPDGFLQALYVDDQGQLWVGTSAGGLARYDADHDKFAVISTENGLSDPAVAAIAGDGGGGLWLGTGAGLDHLDHYGVIRRAPTDSAHAHGLPKGAITAVLMDHDGSVWVGTPQGLWRRPRGSQAEFSAVPLAIADDPHPAISRLFQDSAHRVWVGTRAHGAFVFVAGVAQPVRESGTQTALESDRVTAFAEAMPGEVWIGTYGNGIVAVDCQTGATRRIRHRADTPTSLYDDYIYALYRDRGGLIWVSNIESLSQQDPRNQGVFTLFGGTGRPEGISGKKTFVVAPMPDGHIWLGVNQGIDILDPVLGHVGQVVPDPAHPESTLPKGRVQAIVPGHGIVYIATQQGLYRGDSNGQHLLKITVPERSPSAPVRVLCLIDDVLWVGGDEDGLWALDMHDVDKPVLRQHIVGPQLGDARVASLDRGAGADLWVGTRKGLARVDVVSGFVERVQIGPTDDTELSGAFVSATLTDHRGRLWVALFGYGVQVLQGRDAGGHWHFRRFGVHEGLPHAGIDQILEDRFGNIWASTDNGIAVIDGKSFAIRTLQAPQGVGLRTFFTSAGAATAEGEMLFGGEGGLVVIQPDRLINWSYNPPVVVTDVHVGNLSLPIGPFNRATHPVPLELPPTSHRLRVEFSALDYSSPERNRYAHRLQGFDADWIAVEASSLGATYTNVPPGDYILQLRGSNRDGIWSRPLELPIHVLPAWYETVWFRIAAGFAGLLLIWALVLARTSYLYRRQRELQSLVTKRTAELEQRSLQLRESQRQLELIAYVDSLTGLANRRLFDDEMRERINLVTRDGGSFTLLLIDLDGFKKVNDTLGHDAGDALLKVTAKRLSNAVREMDRVARLGGDEFAIVLSQTSELLAVEAVCRRILQSITEPVVFNEKNIQITASIGSAKCPAEGVTSDSLYKSADIALYEAKRRGRNTWCRYSAAVTS